MLHGLLFMAPALIVALLLLLRRYPGERALHAIRRGLRQRLPRAVRALTGQERAAVMIARGGRLLGSSLAVRPPPVLRAAG